MESYITQSDFFVGNEPEKLAQTYGTPLYVYNERILRERMHEVARVITKYPYTANYSVKANTNIHILKLALEEGLNCDAMSPGEIQLLLKAGFPKERIFFVPNNVAETELEFAIEQGIMTSLDSLAQLELYGQTQSRMRKAGTAAAGSERCAVRINPGIGAGHHEKVVTAGKKTKFGIQEADIPEIFKLADSYGIRIAGINQHIGSLFMDPQPYLDAVTNLLRIAEGFKKLEFIDFGGGYGIPYHKLEDEKPFPMEDFKSRLEPILDDFVSRYGYAPLFKSEPGRFCVAEGSVILGRVHAVKQNSGVTYCGTDVGMNVLVRPSMYDSWHDIEVLREGKAVARHSTADGSTDSADSSGNRDDVLVEQTVTGNICESGDILAKARMLPAMRRGDLACILDTGAYGYSMCSPYNSRPRPAEVLIGKDGSVRVIRRRETIDDILALMDGCATSM
ncbi:MAG: diaminopimelate decarboxylase [Treponemataceae bacterium]|nr:diaminopimelate decarboxylase [Treponemataceae bacterium]